MRERGLILLDTKYEFGVDENGEPLSTVKQHISRSLMALDVKPAHPDPNYFLVKAGDGSELVNPTYTVGDLVQFQVLARDQFQNPSTELCSSTFCESTPLPHVARSTLVSGVEPVLAVFLPASSSECHVDQHLMSSKRVGLSEAKPTRDQPHPSFTMNSCCS